MNYLNENIDSLNKKLQDGEITAEDLAKETVKNIKETDKKINAWITVDEEAKPAENLDFNKNKLAGIPIAIKDNIITNGMKTTAASHILYNYMPVYDATVISKLKKAQATFVGKTNMDEFAMGSSTEHSYYGETHNPWNLDKVPGGSSGGSAAAVASGEVVAALGSDTGGSIRQPAAFNGIFGIKPTYGRVSRWGLIAFGSSLDQIGVMSKRVKDSAEVLNVIAGPDEHDATVSEQEVPDYTSFLGQDVKGLRVAVPKEYMDAVDGEMREVIQKQIDVLKDAGAIINEVSLPHTKYVVPDYYIIASSEASSNLPAFGIGEEVSDPIKMYNNDILTISANLAGIPAGSVPAGLVDGMPAGLQIMAKRFDEGNVFKVADFIERNNKFYEKTPTGMED